MALTVKQISEAITKNGGNITEVAKALGVTRWAVHKRVMHNKELQQLVSDCREEMVDLAESAIKRKIKEGDTASIIFTLKTLGKARGYVERTEHSGAIDLNVVKGYVQVNPDDWDKDAD